MSNLKTIRANISNKNTCLPLLFTYGNDTMHMPHPTCIFYDLNQYDEDYYGVIAPELHQKAIETLVMYYGREDMNSLNIIAHFMPEDTYSITANKITEYWTVKVTQHLEAQKDYSNTLEEDNYFFMFLPKAI